MKLIVGLGNPGTEYARTRHNAGFMVVDRLATRHRLTSPRTKFHAGMLEGPIAGDKCVLLQPVTYMNRSGLAVGEAVGFYKLPLSDLLVVVDDVALPVGRMRLRAGGSAGGHNGLSDIERALGTSEYPRLRIGIDPPGRAPQRDYVLGRFSPDQLLKLDPMLDIAANAIEAWITHGIAKAMSLYNAGET
jgi:PTH1 family peptidyl-tRNA hydrolase